MYDIEMASSDIWASAIWGCYTYLKGFVSYRMIHITYRHNIILINMLHISKGVHESFDNILLWLPHDVSPPKILLPSHRDY